MVGLKSDLSFLFLTPRLSVGLLQAFVFRALAQLVLNNKKRGLHVELEKNAGSNSGSSYGK